MLAYTPSYAVARQLRLHPLVLSKLTSAFNVNSSGLRLNLGLNLKFESKGLKVLGFSRKSANGWEYSPRAVDLITQYMIRFPEFIAKISANPSGDNWEDTAFYPDPQEAKLKMKEIGQWLKSVETKSFEKVPLDAEQLDGDTVMAIQAAAEQNAANPVAMQGRKISGVPRMALLKPSEAQLRTQLQNFSLGDRVVYVLESGRVPIAMRGTVVGKTRTPRSTLLDIVFDSTFMSGTTLNGRCSPFRGSTVSSDAVLNVTERQVLAQSQAARDRAPKPTVTPLRNGYSSTAKSYGSSDGPRLVESQAPPPIRGGWNRTIASRGGPPNGTGRGGGRGGRGGQNDLNNRGRGGGANRGGYNIVDNSDPTEGVNMNNTHFRPQNYSNVPPPAALNHDGRGRGRGGRGRANGGGGRGGGRGRGQSAAV
jgi:5'-3' exoribonuclease 1